MEEENGSWSVYVIQENPTGHIKIGYTKDHKKRMDGLQVGNPRKLSTVYTEKFPREETAQEAESLLHDYLRFYSMSGEWFEFRNFYDGMFNDLKKVGIFSYLDHKNDNQKRALSYDLDQKYKNFISAFTQLISKDIENENLEQVGLVIDEIFKMRVDFLSRIADRKRKTTEALLKLY